MTKIFQTLSLTILIALSSSYSHAIEEEKNELSLQEEITEYINHHVQDSHDFSLFSPRYSLRCDNSHPQNHTPATKNPEMNSSL